MRVYKMHKAAKAAKAAKADQDVLLLLSPWQRQGYEAAKEAEAWEARKAAQLVPLNVLATCLHKLHQLFWMLTYWAVCRNTTSATGLFAQAGITNTRVFELPPDMCRFFEYLRTRQKPMSGDFIDTANRWKEGIAMFSSVKEVYLQFMYNGEDVGFHMALLLLITAIEQFVPGDGKKLLKNQRASKAKGCFSKLDAQKEVETHLVSAINFGPQFVLLWLGSISKNQADWPHIHKALTEQRLQVPEGDETQRVQWDECIDNAKDKMDNQKNKKLKKKQEQKDEH